MKEDRLIFFGDSKVQTGWGFVSEDVVDGRKVFNVSYRKPPSGFFGFLKGLVVKEYFPLDRVDAERVVGVKEYANVFEPKACRFIGDGVRVWFFRFDLNNILDRRSIDVREREYRESLEFEREVLKRENLDMRQGLLDVSGKDRYFEFSKKLGKGVREGYKTVYPQGEGSMFPPNYSSPYMRRPTRGGESGLEDFE